MCAFHDQTLAQLWTPQNEMISNWLWQFVGRRYKLQYCFELQFRMAGKSIKSLEIWDEHVLLASRQSNLFFTKFEFIQIIIIWKMWLSVLCGRKNADLSETSNRNAHRPQKSISLESLIEWIWKKPISRRS